MGVSESMLQELNKIREGGEVRFIPCITALCLVLVSALAVAQETAVSIETVTVTATRIERPAFEIPASIDVIDGSEFNQDGLGVNLSEGLAAVPGLLARDRQNYAQDTQVSIRGFGSRASFGIRGLRLYLDGIPATQPDGQGQISHFNLATADRVEILRGPFSTLYGNSSGGVIQLFTADGETPTRVSGGGAAGSYDTWRANLGASGRLGSAADYVFDYTHFDTGGFRDHSRAERESFNGKLNLRTGTDGKLTLLLNHFDSPGTEDPQGLTRAQFDADPGQAASQPIAFDTRKSARQSQAGLVYTHQLGPEQELRALGYVGQREVEQFLSVPPSSQESETSSGGVVDLDSDYGGMDGRWSWRATMSGLPFSLVAGLNYDELSQDRLGFENFVGEGESQQLGVKGRLRRDEVNDIENFDQYVQASIDPHPRWNAMFGLRHSKVKFDSSDHYVIGGNPDDSGKAEFSETTPVGGLLFRALPQLHLYGAYGRGFETPTFAELAYRPDGESGLNLDLDAARSNNAEVGAKFRMASRARGQLALFHTRTRDEIVVSSAAGGRTTFQNAGRTRRRGAELLIESPLLPKLDAQLAWTWLEAEVRETYTAQSSVDKGKRLPGVAESNLFGSLRWGSESGWHAGIEVRYVDEVPVNDVNIESAPSYTLVGLDGGYVFDLPGVRARTFVKLDNLFDEDYAGSVIVNDGNGRFFEPGPDFNVLAGLRFDWKPGS